jgi:predicted metallo-beta-lactamase superfamily hydrolase
MRTEVKNMPMPPHEPYRYERPPHEEILERLARIEEELRRIVDKLR